MAACRQREHMNAQLDEACSVNSAQRLGFPAPRGAGDAWKKFNGLSPSANPDITHSSIPVRLMFSRQLAQHQGEDFLLSLTNDSNPTEVPGAIELMRNVRDLASSRDSPLTETMISPALMRAL